MPISNEMIDQLLSDCTSPDDVLGENGLLRQLTKKVSERALEAEMESHLGYPNTLPVHNQKSLKKPKAPD